MADISFGVGYLLDVFRFPSFGEVTFKCSKEEYEWQVPVGVTSISAVLIGGGGGGGAGGGQCQRSGGGGGGLRWINGMPVSPGETLIIKSGLGGTCGVTSTLTSNSQFWYNNPGFDSYIASNNNANVPGRTGIGDTIIVFAQGGGQFPVPPTTGNGSEEGYLVSNNNQDVLATAGIGTSGGSGSAFGSFDWGTIGGGNGGHGGRGRGTGGGVSGAGAGAGGYTGNGGNGGEAASNGNPGGSGSTLGQNGEGGGAGGGNCAEGGGANAGGGGGGTGVYWGNGESGLGANLNLPGTTALYTAWVGQAGSWGADGRSSSEELTFTEAGGSFTYPSSLDFANEGLVTPTELSIGNGIRGYNDSLDDQSAVGFATAAGGFYGGGGGGTDSSSKKPYSGAGGCGVVRIIFAARVKPADYGQDAGVLGNNDPSVTRNYPGGYDANLTIAQNVSNGWSGINTTNILTNYGFPTLPPIAGGPNPIIGEFISGWEPGELPVSF